MPGSRPWRHLVQKPASSNASSGSKPSKLKKRTLKSGASASGSVVSPVPTRGVPEFPVPTSGAPAVPVVCKFFRTKRGCARRDRCPFLHQADDQSAITAAAAGSVVSPATFNIDPDFSASALATGHVVSPVAFNIDPDLSESASATGRVESPVAFSTDPDLSVSALATGSVVSPVAFKEDPVGPTAVYIAEGREEREKDLSEIIGTEKKNKESGRTRTSKARRLHNQQQVEPAVDLGDTVTSLPNTDDGCEPAEAPQTFVPKVPDRRQIGDEAFWTRPVTIDAIMPSLPRMPRLPALRARTRSPAAFPKSVRLGFPPVPKVPPKARPQAPSASGKGFRSQGRSS